MASDARSDKESAGPDRPHRATQDFGQTGSRNEEERQGIRSKDRIEADKEEGQLERENAGKNR